MTKQYPIELKPNPGIDRRFQRKKQKKRFDLLPFTEMTPGGDESFVVEIQSKHGLNRTRAAVNAAARARGHRLTSRIEHCEDGKNFVRFWRVSNDD